MKISTTYIFLILDFFKMIFINKNNASQRNKKLYPRMMNFVGTPLESFKYCTKKMSRIPEKRSEESSAAVDNLIADFGFSKELSHMC